MDELTDRELDAQIAEKVMGWRKKIGDDPVFQGVELWSEDESIGSARPCVYWHPTESISDAMEVIEKMSTTTKEYWTLEVFSTGTRAVFDYEGGRDLSWTPGEHVGEAESLPRAICLAALAALKVE